MRRWTTSQRRARLGVRHRLAAEARADDPVGAARGVVALHSTDPASVFLSAWARMHDGDVAGMQRTLYEDRTLVRVMGMRRTVFVAAPEDAAIIIAACGRDVGAGERRTLLALLADAGVSDPPARLAEAERLVTEALHEHGELTAAELGALDERLRLELVIGRGPLQSRQRLASRVLLILAAEGRVVRARPRGTWTSTQFRWAALDAWAPAAVPRLGAAEARGELARRWLQAFGPATAADLRWWTRWTARDTRHALEAAGAVEVDLDGGPGVALGDDLEPLEAPEPWVALLPALDPTSMGWKDRAFAFGDLEARLFDRTGNASPTIWCDGRVVGGWAQRPDGEIVVELLADVGAEAAAAVEVRAARLQAQLGDVRLAPRARTRSAVEAALLA